MNLFSFEGFTFQAPTEITFGAGTLQKIGKKISKDHVKKLMVVTDQNLSKAGIANRITNVLEKEKIQYTVFDQVDSEPTLEVVKSASKKFKEEECDVLLGFGGGSCIDTAKAVGILSTNPGNIVDYEGANKIKKPIVPLIAIPTTAGSGSEVTGTTVIVDLQLKRKISVRSPYIIPSNAILDPTLLTSLPASVAADSGIDTVAHALEAYVSTNSFQITDALAIGALKLAKENLPAFVANRENIEAAGNMQIACTMAGLAFTWARVVTTHALGTALGGFYRIPHGLACALMLPPVMEFSYIGNKKKFADITKIMKNDISNMTLDEAAKESAELIRQFMYEIGINQGLKELGVSEDSLIDMAIEAERSGICTYNPRKCTVEDLVNMYKAAM